MTKSIKVLIIGMFILSHPIFAQTIEFKDSLFKDALLKCNPKIDLNGNHEIEISEAKKVNKLSINGFGITKLSEISFFINLEELSCYDNKIDSLILENLPQLREVYCRSNLLSYLKLKDLQKIEDVVSGQNQLSHVIIENCPKIESLTFEENKLLAIDLSDLSNLKYLYLSNNQLTSIDISKNLDLVQISIDYNKLNELDIRNNTKIKYIYVDDNVKRIMNEEQRNREYSPFLSKPPSMSK